ncbi:hypothetical protein ABEV00_21940 [Paenibacillus thiaminolyticus]|uniref:hypothetical protein n=1 Tax=Paenibacillus thiaminolyticus TaxID=49283 RepID=UPI003D2C8E69
MNFIDNTKSFLHGAAFFIGGMKGEEEKEASKRSAEAASQMQRLYLGRVDRNKAILRQASVCKRLGGHFIVSLWKIEYYWVGADHMNNKSKVQNPLTIIAIFAGIAEIAGTAVLLALPIEIQRIFVWFVIGFPCGLVAVFFAVLVFKNEVLYAPSDFIDENHFISILNRKKTKKVGHKLDEVSNLVSSMITETRKLVEPEETDVQVIKDISDKLDIVLNKVESARQSNNDADFNDKFILTRDHRQILIALEEAGTKGLSERELSANANVNYVFLDSLTQPLIRWGLIGKRGGRYFFDVD